MLCICWWLFDYFHSANAKIFPSEIGGYAIIIIFPLLTNNRLRYVIIFK